MAKSSDFGRTEGAVRLYAGAAGASAELDLRGDQNRKRFLLLRTPTTAIQSRFSRLPWANPDTCRSARFTKPRTPSMVGNSAGRVKVKAAPTKAVALAPDLVTYLQASEACWRPSDTVLEGLVGPTYTPLKQHVSMRPETSLPSPRPN